MRHDHSIKMRIDYHFCSFLLPSLYLLYAWTTPHMDHVRVDCSVWACWLPHVGGSVVGQNNCHTWATSVSVECHVCASWLPFLYLLIATCGPLVCHIGASCLPRGPDNGHIWASIAKPVWPTRVPQVGAFSTATCGPCVAHLWNVCWVHVT